MAKPELHCAMDKISLILNVGITTRAGFNCIQKLISNHFIFNTTISGISLSQSLSMGQLSQVLSFFNGQQYSNISYDASLVSDTQVMPSLVIGGCLWLYSHQHQPQYQNYPSMLDKVLSNCTCRPFTMLVGNYDKKLFCTIPSSSIRAFAVLPDTEYSFNILHHSSESLKSVLLANKNTLEYLQLHRFPTALFGAMELHSLSNLRVLSVSSRTAKGHSPSTPIIQVCQTLQTLNLLEYFEWADVINLFANDLIAIYTTLKDYLPRLNHWHMSSFKVVLFTTLSDEDRKILDDLYKNLMEGKTGDVTCSTYKFSLDNLHFKNWLVLARPDVCINLQNKSKMVATSCLTF